MVPSDRSEKISYTSESTPENSGLSTHVEGDDFNRLIAMFNEVEPAEQTESHTQLGEAALADIAEPAAEATSEEAEPSQARHHTPAHAGDHHHDTQQASSRPFNRKEQEELWGAKDKINPEDVPEGELTYEQYLAMRPKAEEGDVLHSTDKNGRTIVYDALSGHRVKEADYLKQDAHKSFNAELYEKKANQRSYDEAAKENAEYDARVKDELRNRAEGKVFVDKDDRLKGLALLGQELLDLRDSTTKRKRYTPELQATLAAKEAAFKDLFALYQEKGLESRGLDYINDTLWKPYEDISHVPHQGKAFYEGKHVAVHDVITSPAGDTAYRIQDARGDQLTVQAAGVEFKQEFEAPKRSFFERAGRFFKKFAADWQEFGGTAALQDRWNSATDWLFNRHITPDMTPEQIQEQKEKNRRNNMIGTAAVFIGGAAAIGLSIWAGSSVHEHLAGGDIPNLGSGGGESAASVTDALSPNGSHTPDTPEALPLMSSPETGATEPIAEAIQNPAYEIPDGGTGLGLFERLGLSGDMWNAHAQELVQKFPNEFYNEGGDVRLMNSGWLSEDARRFIESLKG